MAEEEKTFKVICAPCKRPFHVRFPLAAADAEGTGEVVVECQYCEQPVKIEIPRVYIREDALTRGLGSARA